MTPQRRIAVIGAGISGLTTAYRLQDHGCDVEVFEADSRPGGRIGSSSRDEYLLEKGPHTILQRNAATRDLIDDLGLREQVVVANEEANRRYVVRDGVARPIPMSFGDFLETDLLSRDAKVRLLGEPFVPPRSDDVDETLASFVRRRFGDELLDYAVAPFVGGIYAGSPRRLSAKHGFRRLWELEQTGGSVTGGAILERLILQRLFGSDEPDDDVERTLLSFQGGARQLIDRLSDALDGHLHTEAPVEHLERIPGAGVWRLGGDGAAGEERPPFDDVVWTGPTYRLADLSIEGTRVGETEPGATLERVDYPPVSVVAMGLREGQVDHPLDGFGVLVPEVEPFDILGCLFISTLFPGRAPEGHVLLSTFVGGARNPALAEAPDQEITSVVRQDLQDLLGVTGEPEMVDIIRWPRAIPQYDVGYGRMFAAAEAIEDRYPGLHLAGNFRDGISVPELIDTAAERAEGLATRPPRLHAPQRRTG
jgi:oxygen-dependent protoporphyrinogen oxidase